MTTFVFAPAHENTFGFCTLISNTFGNILLCIRDCQKILHFLLGLFYWRLEPSQNFHAYCPYKSDSDTSIYLYLPIHVNCISEFVLWNDHICCCHVLNFLVSLRLNRPPATPTRPTGCVFVHRMIIFVIWNNNICDLKWKYLLLTFFCILLFLKLATCHCDSATGLCICSRNDNICALKW